MSTTGAPAGGMSDVCWVLGDLLDRLPWTIKHEDRLNAADGRMACFGWVSDLEGRNHHGQAIAMLMKVEAVGHLAKLV